MFKITILIAFSLNVFYCTQLYLDEGETCSSGYKNKVCKHIKNCPSALKLLKNYSHPPICTFRGIEPIVCCDEKDSINTSAEPSHISHCRKYTTYKNKFVKKTRIDPDLIHSRTKSEGRRRRQIFNGETASAGEFPFMAAIGYGSKDNKVYKCGGTLISENFVVTAAHCIYSRNDGYAVFVRLGDLNINRSEDDIYVQDFDIVERIHNPSYEFGSYLYDIALLRLDRNVVITRYVIPACLHDEFQINTRKGIAAGWGALEFMSEGSDVLLKAELYWYSVQNCSKHYKTIVPELQVCAGGETETKDTCQGDSGGPLQIFNKDEMYTLVGITSFGRVCGSEGVPGVYTRVSYFIKWIEDTVWNNP